MLYRVGFFCFFCLFCLSLFSAEPSEQVYLKTPKISQENIIETNVGIRPFRKTGVRLEAEPLNEKLIIHNYGYGGSGLTLAFGGAKEVLDTLAILEKQKAPNTPSKVVAVLGAGIIGLATAYDLLQHGYNVHIYCEEWSPNLTSNVAAGIWTPLTYPADLPEEKKRLHQRLLETSEARFLKSASEAPEFAGVRMIEAYSFKPQNSQAAEGDVVVHFDNGLIQHCRRFEEIGIEGKVFMEDLQAKVKSKGAKLLQRRFEKLDDVLGLEEPIIINCMSMGSRKVFNDQEFMPVRGQVIHLKHQEGVDYYAYNKYLPKVPGETNYFAFFIYPWSDRLILGGVYEFGQEEPVRNPEVIDRILDNAERCLSPYPG